MNRYKDLFQKDKLSDKNMQKNNISLLLKYHQIIIEISIGVKI